MVLGSKGVESFKEADFIFNHKSQWPGRKSSLLECLVLTNWLSDYGIYAFMVFIIFCYVSWYLEDIKYLDISN